MFCSRCGKSLMLEDQQCPHCGHPVGESRFAGTPYTSAQAHIIPGAASYASRPSNSETSTAYTRTTYTTMSEEQQQAGDVDSRTTYRPVYEGASAPEDIRRDMRSAVDGQPEETAEPLPENLSPEAINTLNAVDEELKMENMDLSQFRSRPIRSSGRAGISSDVNDYIQKLEANQSRKAARKKRVYDEEADESYATPQEDYVYDDQPVNPNINTEQPEVFDDINEEEFEELRYGRTIGVREILKVSLFLVIAAAVIVGVVLGIRYMRNSQSAAPIEGVTETLYEEGIAKIKSHVATDYVNNMVAVVQSDGLLALSTRLQEAADEIDALMPTEPAENDALFISALQAIQTNIGNAILMDGSAATQNATSTQEESDARWSIVNNSIAQLESATSAAELTAILNGEQITVATTATPTPEPTKTYATLSKGDKNDDVLDMQNRLYELGYLLDDRDGAFGSKTQTAVKLFQKDAGIEVTGIADSATLAAMYADDAPRTEYAQPTPTPTPTETPQPSPSAAPEASNTTEVQ